MSRQEVFLLFAGRLDALDIASCRCEGWCASVRRLQYIRELSACLLYTSPSPRDS